MDKREKRAQLLAEMKALNDKAKAETRSFNDEESKAYAEKDAEVRKLTAEIEAEEREAALNGFTQQAPKPAAEDGNSGEEKRAMNFVQTGHMEMRALLASGSIAKPSKAGTEVNELAPTADSIVDDVHGIPLTGIGSWVAAYRDTNTTAGGTVDGSKIGDKANDKQSLGTFNTVTISPDEWGVLDEISKQVKKMSPVNYEASVKAAALNGLRAKAAAKIIAAVKASSLKKSTTYALDKEFVRSLVLGFRAVPGKGPCKLYITQKDLADLGKVRGTNEKLPVFDISFTDETNISGTIKDGGTAVSFRVTDGLTDGTQLYGQPGSIDMPMWDNYAIETDEGGEYFQKNLMGIRGVQTANADLVVKYGMQVNTSTPST